MNTMNDEQLEYVGMLAVDDDIFYIQQSNINKLGGVTLVFGDACNAGFIEQGRIEGEAYESLDEVLATLNEELDLFSQYGKGATSRIV